MFDSVEGISESVEYVRESVEYISEPVEDASEPVECVEGLEIAEVVGVSVVVVAAGGAGVAEESDEVDVVGDDAETVTVVPSESTYTLQDSSEQHLRLVMSYAMQRKSESHQVLSVVPQHPGTASSG